MLCGSLISFKLDVDANGIQLKESLLWDPFGGIESPDAPEEFAQRLCLDLGLDSTFATVIAGQIRTQLLQHLEVLSCASYDMYIFKVLE